jgi:hypothetical protein
VSVVRCKPLPTTEALTFAGKADEVGAATLDLLLIDIARQIVPVLNPPLGHISVGNPDKPQVSAARKLGRSLPGNTAGDLLSCNTRTSI